MKKMSLISIQNFVWALIFVIVSIPTFMNAQPLDSNSGKENVVDTLSFLYSSFNKLYLDFTKQEGTVSNLNTGMSTLRKDFTNLNGLLDENSKAMKKITTEVTFLYRTQYYSRRDKIINTAGFIEAANVSLNGIFLLDRVTDYLGEITSLNSPQNKELGFSLFEEIKGILEDNIFKGKSKINEGRSSKILDFANNILTSPMTEAISNAFPVVSSIKSVVDLVMGVAVGGDDVSAEDINQFKTALKDYISHYEGLDLAKENFDNQLNVLKVRKVALSNLLRQYTIERVNTLAPGSIAKSDSSSLTSIINQKYTREIVKDLIEIIESKNGIPSVNGVDKIQDDVFSKGLVDKKMGYPTYAESQARFIRDEILAISSEYIIAYDEYQKAIEKVFGETLKKNIAKKDLVERKINTLRTKLTRLKKVFNESINADQLNIRFDRVDNNP